MKTGSSCLTLVVLMLLCTSGKGDEKLTFDKVVVVKGVRSVDLLYVVLTEPNVTNDKLDELVVKYAAAALSEAAEHKFEGATKGNEKPKYNGNVVFLVRQSRDARSGFASGFGVEQLQEIIAATPDAGRKLAGRHSWGKHDIPGGEAPPKDAAVSTKILPQRFLVLEATPKQNPANPKQSVLQLKVSPHYGKIDEEGLKFRMENETQELTLLICIEESGEEIRRGDIISFEGFKHLKFSPGSQTIRHLPSGRTELVP
jgi:hypothetical protein